MLVNATFSQRLKDRVLELEEDQEYDYSDCFDLTSTAGYDNDGSTGPEMVDNGIGLGLACVKHGPDAKIFFAEGEDNDGWSTCYFLIGNDEGEALARLAEKVAELTTA